MNSKQTRLIERAAARLTGTLGERPQAAPNEVILGSQLSLGRSTVSHRTQIRDGDAARSSEPNGRSLPQIDLTRLARAGLVRDRDSRVAEEFRIVQNRVLRQSFGDIEVAFSQKSNLVMVTSALKGEGKSFVSLNLAGEVARHGHRRVLLIDVDPKPNDLSEKLGLLAARGLVDLVRDAELENGDVIVPTELEHLDVLPFGTKDEKSSEVFASRRMGDIIEGIGRGYPDRLILVDAPPCLSSSTPHALASLCGQVVLVVAAGNTQQEDIEAALDLLQTCEHVSLLLNKVAPWMAHSFGSYSYDYLAAEAAQ